MPLATPDPRRRLFVQGAMLGTLRLVAAFNVILLVAICLFLLVQGLPALSWEFLSTPPREMMTAGGILPCIVGTAILALGSLLPHWGGSQETSRPNRVGRALPCP